jgi:dynein assembly factor 3, axonemal
VLKPIIHFDNLKFKERDELEDVISSYYNVHPFDIEKMRDTRLRAFFGDRYDHRRNLIDWDYGFEIKPLCPFMHTEDYKTWRMTGLAFEIRLASNTVPNRTMGSYVPGNDVSAIA